MSRVRAEMVTGRYSVVVIIADKGMTESDRHKVASYRLVSMRQRAAAVGGALGIACKPIAGVTIKIHSPLAFVSKAPV